MSPTPQAPVQPPERELIVISHSNLFYWWPVWVVGFLMALLTYLGDNRLAIVPPGTEAVSTRQVEGFKEPRDVLVAPAEKALPSDDSKQTLDQPHHRVSRNKDLGAIFLLVLLLVIFVTNIPLRGLWSAVTLLIVVVLTLFFSLMGWWGSIFDFFGLMHVYINTTGYLIISSVLFGGWVLTTLLFDRQVYMIFSPGQFRIHLEIGQGETAFDSMGLVVHKRRDDLFRHWVLGLGSGDLLVKTGGANPQTFEIPNVLFVGRKLYLVEQMMQEREVVKGQLEQPAA